MAIERYPTTVNNTIRRQVKLLLILPLIGLTVIRLTCCHEWASAEAKDYYYTRTRRDPNHLRVSEEFKNNYINDIKYESRINGTKYEYYKSRLTTISYDELVFETIDKIFRHRLSAFYLHHYDNEDDKRRSFDPNKVSHEACARDLLYLVDKIPVKRSQITDEDQLTPELAAFFDSYARQEAGLLMGNTFWVGAYDQCVNRHIFELIDTYNHPARQQHRQFVNQFGETDDSSADYDQATSPAGDRDQKVVSFRGRYCVASLKAPIWDKIIKLKRENAKDYFKTEQQLKEYSKLFRLQAGICLPDSCDSTSLERHSDEIRLLTTFMLGSRYSDYDLIDLYCLPDETSPLRQWSGSALYFLVFVTLWLICNILATIADVFEFVEADTSSAVNYDPTKTKPKRIRQLICWFSLRANYNKLMRVSGDQGRDQNKQTPDPMAKRHDDKTNTDTVNEKRTETSTTQTRSGHDKTTSSSDQLQVDLRFLNAFKVMIMFWIVNGHIMLLMIQTAKNILYSDALLNGLMHFLIGATFGVDLFFTMTGFLTSYLIFNSGHAYKMKMGTWLYLSFHRYWRLAPMYLLVFWFSRSVMQLLGSGPLWDYGTSALTFRGLCTSESWWYPLTLTSNLHGLFEECMITSWYISCDMQFWLVSPIFIHLLAKSPTSGWTASLATILASSKVRYDAILGEKSARYDELVQPRADIFMRVSHDLPALYTHPHYRIAAYLVGLLAGHYVYMVKSGQWRSLISHDLWFRQHPHSYASQQVAAECQDGGQDEGSNKLDGGQTTAPKSPTSSATNPKEKQLLPNRVQSSRRIRSLIAYLGLTMFLVMSFVSYLLSHYYPASMLKYSKTVAAAAYSIDHLVMSVGASLIIISMCFGQWSKIVGFLSHPNWTRLSKINYALLLLQCEAIYYQIFRFDQVPVAGTRELINLLFNILVTLYPLAFVATLVFEFPLANIEKLIL